MKASQESLAEDVAERVIDGLDNESLDRNDTSTLEGEDQVGLHTLRALKEKCSVAAGLGQPLLLLMIFGHGDPKTYEMAIGDNGHPRKAPRLGTSQIAACLRGSDVSLTKRIPPNGSRRRMEPRTRGMVRLARLDSVA